MRGGRQRAPATQADTFIIAYYLPVSMVAVYAIVTKLFYILRGVYGTLLAVVQPMVFSATHQNDLVFIKKLALKGFKYILVLYVPLIILASIISTPFITLWMGEEYGKYGLWSSVFLLQYLYAPSVGVFGTISVGMSKLKYIQIYGIFSALSNVILSILLVQHYGFYGVILGTVITTFFGIFIIYPYYCKALTLNWKQPLKQNYQEFLLILFFLINGFLIINNLEISTWIDLIIFCFVFVILIYFVMFLLFIEKEDKVKFYLFLKSIEIKWLKGRGI